MNEYSIYNRQKCPCLKTHPPAVHKSRGYLPIRIILKCGIEKGDKRCCIQVNIVLYFLWCCVMFLMHRIPDRGTNTASKAHRKGLNRSIDRTDAGKTKVTAFVLHPTTAGLKCDEREKRCVYVIRRQPRSHSEIKCEFEHTEINMDIIRFKTSLIDKVCSHLSEIRRHFLLAGG